MKEPPSMSRDDDDIEQLIIQLSASLHPDQSVAFIAAARSALAVIPCVGPGAAYRALVPLQRRYFDPPADRAAGIRPLSLHMKRPSKLMQGQAIGRDDPRSGKRVRHALEVVR
jgi:hypothetical protein